MIGNLTLDQLRVLVTIAETGSFSATGRKLERAQSAISQAIATLENMQGVALFDRSGRKPTLTEVGRALVGQARIVLSAADRFEAVAAGTRTGIEPELAVAIDPLVPTGAFIDSLQALEAEFPSLPVSFFTEGLRGAERRLRRGEASLAFCVLFPAVPDDIVALPLLDIEMIPVVAASHPLAQLGRPVRRADLERYVQLVLSDAVEVNGPNYGVVSLRVWRFVDLARRVDFLMAGLGWCRMPLPLVKLAIADGRLVRLKIGDESPPSDAVTIYAAHMRDRLLGRAGTWLLNHLRARLA